jgi:uncharacterized protein YlxW (UPF0749 family)
MNGNKKVHILALAFLTVFLLFGSVNAVSPEPGSPEDPVVSKSYVDNQVYLLTQEINALKEEISQLRASLDAYGGSVGGFKVLTLTAGQTLVAGGGTEIILRSGAATAISGELGGLADVTSGLGTAHDLKTGQNVPQNHLLIVSRDDGRGIKATSETVYVLVKGPYTIK